MTLPSFLGPLTPVGTPPLGGAPPVPAGGGANPLAFTMQRQSQSEWCWAATASSVSAFYNPASTWSECLVASSCLTQPCCTAPAPCNIPYYLNTALTYTGNLNAGGTGAGSATFGAVQTEINGGRPVCCHISWRGGGGHFVALYGYDAATQDVDVGDPLFGDQTMLYVDFVNRYRTTGTWDWTYLTT